MPTTPTDPVNMVKNLLSTNWGTVDGVPGYFTSPETYEESKGYPKGVRDVFKVYTARPRTRERLDGRYEFATYRAYVKVKGLTSGTSSLTPSAHGENLMRRVESIIHTNRQNPDSYWDFMYVDSYQIVWENPKSFSFEMIVVVQRIGGSVA